MSYLLLVFVFFALFYKFVSVDRIRSQELEIEHKILKGSILRLLIFLVYINDITDLPRSPHLVRFADDSNVLFSSNTKASLQPQANDYLGKLSKWLEKLKSNLTEKKTKYIKFKPINKRGNSEIHLEFNSVRIAHVEEKKSVFESCLMKN